MDYEALTTDYTYREDFCPRGVLQKQIRPRHNKRRTIDLFNIDGTHRALQASGGKTRSVVQIEPSH